MERVINKDKRKAIKVFEKIMWNLISMEDDVRDIKFLANSYSDCVRLSDEECLDVLDKYDNDCTLEKKMRKLVELHNEFEKALDAYKNYMEENF